MLKGEVGRKRGPKEQSELPHPLLKGTTQEKGLDAGCRIGHFLTVLVDGKTGASSHC